MPETARGAGLTPLRGERLERFLAELAAAPGAAAAGQCLADAFGAAVGAVRVLFYVLEEGERALRLAAATPDGAQLLAPPIVERDRADAQPLFAAALSLSVLATDADAPGPSLPAGAWVAVPLPQPRLSWSSPPIALDAALRLAGGRWRAIVPAHGERRGRVGLAPLGVAVLQLPERSAPDLVADALTAAAAHAGPALSRGLAVEQYRETAERLDRQRTLLSGLIDSLPDPVLLSNRAGAERDSAGSLLARNGRAAMLFEAPDDASEAWRRAVEGNSALLAALLAAPPERPAAGAPPVPRELALTDPGDGAALLFEVSDHALRGGDGPATGGDDGARLVVLRDVTALRRAGSQLEAQVERARVAEREATRERDRLDRILDYVADPIVVSDRDGVVVEANRQALRLLGGRDERSEHQAANRDAVLAATRGLADEEASRRARLTLVDPATGDPLPIEVVAGRVAGAEGEPPVVVSVLHDLTKHVENERLYEELKRFSAVLEARVRAATADLAEQNARLQSQSHELERANRLKSEFLASMSHELRTPINALIGYTALLRDRVYGELNPRQEDGLRRIQTSAEHLLALINDILDLARIEAGRMPVHLERVLLAPLLRDATTQTEALARAKELDFTLEMPAAPLAIHTDPDKLRQVLANLLSNALKFTSRGGITVRAVPVGGRVRIDVSDTGIGIAAEDLGTIWDDFRQLDQSRTREYGGTGLGLSIVRKLADRLDAEVRVASTPDVGSTFSVLVPASREPERGPER